MALLTKLMELSAWKTGYSDPKLNKILQQDIETLQ